MNSIDRALSDAIHEATRIQDEENLDLDGIFAYPHWAPELFEGSASRNGTFSPRFPTVITTEEGIPLLVCSKLQRNAEGFERDGLALEDIIGLQNGLTKGAIEAAVSTGGYRFGSMLIVPLAVFDPLGYNMAQLSALVNEDPKAKEKLTELLSENSKRTASQQVSVEFFGNDGSVIGPTLYDSLNAGIKNKDENKVTIPYLLKSVTGGKQIPITIGMIHEGAIVTKGEGLRIPKFSRGCTPKNIGYTLIRFTGVTKSHREVLRESWNKRKPSTKRRAASTKRKAASTKRRAASTKKTVSDDYSSEEDSSEEDSDDEYSSKEESSEED